MTSKWLYLFEGSGVAYGPINDMKNVFAEPQVLHNGLIMEMKHPTVGKISVPGAVLARHLCEMDPALPHVSLTFFLWQWRKSKKANRNHSA
uniref:succinate--hydroxymethylglutarate CoA-transferase-like isoform X2 n=1 Tax=Halichoerus grypus TaxID=9711 RepID=UPI001659F0CD|nr:succinate--hydroxymethylglutarate CoA-transferase-like isoform X2 [Halichoerus grypus]